MVSVAASFLSSDSESNAVTRDFYLAGVGCGGRLRNAEFKVDRNSSNLRSILFPPPSPSPHLSPSFPPHSLTTDQDPAPPRCRLPADRRSPSSPGAALPPLP